MADMMLYCLVGLTTALLCLNGVLAQPRADEITSLPGVSGSLSSRQYSGYLAASGTIQLHYWFVESQRDPVNDPLVLWMNGGPGCSSLDGFLAELGPYGISDDGTTIVSNPYSWSKVANLLFLEAPAGVGFSYSANKNYTTSDDETSKNNYIALLDFYAKFPHLVGKPLYITGESYAGIYVPTLAGRVMANASINLQGFAIGNGFLDNTLNTDTAVYYAYYHGIIGEDAWAKLQKYCCVQRVCHFAKPTNKQCAGLVLSMTANIASSGINPYDVTGDCAGGIPAGALSRQRLLSFYLGNQKFGTTLDATLDKNIIPCIDTSAERKYLNRPDVRKALHIPSFVPPWKVCSAIDYHNQYSSMRAQVQSLLRKHRGLIYNGDADIMCNFLGDQQFVASLGRKELKDRRPWVYQNQVAGFVKEYDHVTFMTVKNAGHMVPTFVPGQALQMISNFLSDKSQ